MSKKAPFKEGVSVSFQLSKVCHMTFMENGPCKKSFGKKKKGRARKKCWFTCDESIYGRYCWNISCIHCFLLAEFCHQMFCFMTFYNLFAFSQWTLNEMLLVHGRRSNPSGKPGPRRRLSIQSICTINPILRLVDFCWKVLCILMFGELFL